MRRLLGAATMVAAALAVPATAFAQNGAQNGNLQLQGFGGLTVRGISTATTFGGNIAVPLGSNVQIVAEGGRMTDIMSPMLSTLLDFTPVDVRLSAYYGEGGVRLLGPSDSVVRPYAEATVGMARLRTGFTGAGARNDALINTALLFVGTTRPMLGAGGGLLIQGGPVLVDLGYRFNKITAGNAIQSVLAGGDLTVHQVRVGVGVRF